MWQGGREAFEVERVAWVRVLGWDGLSKLEEQKEVAAAEARGAQAYMEQGDAGC